MTLWGGASASSKGLCTLGRRFSRSKSPLGTQRAQISVTPLTRLAASKAGLRGAVWQGEAPRPRAGSGVGSAKDLPHLQIGNSMARSCPWASRGSKAHRGTRAGTKRLLAGLQCRGRRRRPGRQAAEGSSCHAWASPTNAHLEEARLSPPPPALCAQEAPGAACSAKKLGGGGKKALLST